METDYLVIGAGAAGITAAKLLAASEKGASVLLADAHTEPGGQAGHFGRGGPRRVFDAGATQLVDCEPGGLQDLLLGFGAQARTRAFQPVFHRIPRLTHHFLVEGATLTLDAHGMLLFEQGNTHCELDAQGAGDVEGLPHALVEDLRALQHVLAVCEREAAWMWKVFKGVPRFPLQTASDVVRALSLAQFTPPTRAFAFPFLLGARFSTACEALGLRKEHVFARRVLAGLLLDTTQNAPEDSPWLAGLMGVSILRKGIYRAEGGMRSLFQALLADTRAEGATVLWRQRATRIAAHGDGWEVDFTTAARGNAPSEKTTVRVRKGLVCNLTLWNLVGLLERSTALEENRTFRAWTETAAEETGWGAFAVYATLADNPAWPDAPWYHQVFPRALDEGTLAGEANYVSISGRLDPANPKGERVLTTTLHVPARPLSELERTFVQNALVVRTERALGTELLHVETATPQTFERFTHRAQGQVGGFRMSPSRFLLNAPPSFLRVSGTTPPLCVAGDTVFPGQGIIACMLSGVAAWERLTGRSFRKEAPSSP